METHSLCSMLNICSIGRIHITCTSSLLQDSLCIFNRIQIRALRRSLHKIGTSCFHVRSNRFRSMTTTVVLLTHHAFRASIVLYGKWNNICFQDSLTFFSVGSPINENQRRASTSRESSPNRYPYVTRFETDTNIRIIITLSKWSPTLLLCIFKRTFTDVSLLSNTVSYFFIFHDWRYNARCTLWKAKGGARQR